MSTTHCCCPAAIAAAQRPVDRPLLLSSSHFPLPNSHCCCPAAIAAAQQPLLLPSSHLLLPSSSHFMMRGHAPPGNERKTSGCGVVVSHWAAPWAVPETPGSIPGSHILISWQTRSSAMTADQQCCRPAAVQQPWQLSNCNFRFIACLVHLTSCFHEIHLVLRSAEFCIVPAFLIFRGAVQRSKAIIAVQHVCCCPAACFLALQRFSFEVRHC